MPTASRLSSGRGESVQEPRRDLAPGHFSWRALALVLLAGVGAALVGLTPAPAAGPALLVGVNAHPLQNAYAIYPAAQVLDRAAALGLEVVRIDVHWDWLEWTAPGTAGWDPEQTERLDAFVEAAQRRKIRVLAVVMDTPCWASSDPARVCGPTRTRYNWREPPANPRDYADFLARLVRRYRGQIQYWEIWNEPNLPQFWPRPDPVAYTRLLGAAYPAIKAVDPTATVLAGALSPVGPGEKGYPALDFVDAMYAAGAKGSFDALSFHPYSLGPPLAEVPPGPHSTAPVHLFLTSVPALHEQMLRAGDPRPIWITEAGWATAPEGGACAPSTGLASEADQARFLADEVRLARTWGFVEGFVWYELFDRGGSSSCDPEDHFGILRRDLGPKPAGCTLRSILAAGAASDGEAAPWRRQQHLF